MGGLVSTKVFPIGPPRTTQNKGGKKAPNQKNHGGKTPLKGSDSLHHTAANQEIGKGTKEWQKVYCRRREVAEGLQREYDRNILGERKFLGEKTQKPSVRPPRKRKETEKSNGTGIGTNPEGSECPKVDPPLINKKISMEVRKGGGGKDPRNQKGGERTNSAPSIGTDQVSQDGDWGGKKEGGVTTKKLKRKREKG